MPKVLHNNLTFENSVNLDVVSEATILVHIHRLYRDGR